MIARRRRRGRAILFALFAFSAGAGLFAACASGSSLQPSGSGGSGASGSTGHGHGGDGGNGGSVIKPGEVGAPCDSKADCMHDADCTLVGSKAYCTVPCPPDCPEHTYCTFVKGTSQCVPDLDQECKRCSGTTDCTLPTNLCLTAPLGDRFCARDCTTLGLCPNGFECTDAIEYANGGSGGGAGTGGSGAGTGGAGGSPGTGGGSGGVAGSGGSPPANVPTKYCVPSNGSSCPCDAKRDGVDRTCSVDNSFGSCSGKETCDASAGKFKGCDAKTPKKEVCNAKDDNCDQATDEGDPNDLCADMGPPPPNSSWLCENGMCKMSPCADGFVQYPPGSPGCTCQKEIEEPNDTCATAADKGAVSDAGGSIVLTGTLSSDVDVDYWTFQTTDTDEVSTNSYHVHMDFTAPATNDEFQMDVTRGTGCSNAPTGPSTNLTSYDWCVDAFSASGPIGEAGCGPTATVHCNDNSSPYFVRVHRKSGAPKTCAQYSITVTAAGAPGCDLTLSCP